MWHANDGLGPEAIAALLRDPPLKVQTVVAYILDAIAAEGLPYCAPRLRAELMPLLLPRLAAGRYRRLARACEADDALRD